MKKRNTPSDSKPRKISRSEALETRKRLETLEEAPILALLKREADAFVPDVYTKAELATGLFKAIATQDEFSLTEILGNEAKGIIPDLEKNILAQTGIKKGLRFGRLINLQRALAIGGAAVSLALIIASSVAISAPAPAVVAPGGLVNVSITPASRSLTEADSTYSPEFVIVPTEKTAVRKGGFVPLNLSASYVASSLPSGNEAELPLVSAVTSIMDASYEQGYIEAKETGAYNHIQIEVFSGHPENAEACLNGMITGIKKSLEGKKVYAKIDWKLNITDVEMTDWDYEEASSLLSAYALFEGMVPVDVLKKEAGSIITSFDSIAKAMARAKLSDITRTAFKRGLTKSYARYLDGPSQEFDTAKTIQSLKKRLEKIAGQIPWLIGDGSILEDNVYYLLSDSELFSADMPGSREAVDLFLGIQDALFDWAAINKEHYLSFLSAVSSFLTYLSEDAHACPDPYGSSFDPGNHEPGSGPLTPGWGNGEIIVSSI